jgi:hypothetical protein
MAYKRFKRARAGRRSAGKRRSRHSNDGGLFKGVIGAALYGGVRGYASNMVAPLTSKLGMLGTYADNVVMIGALWGLGKVMPQAKPICKTGILIEAAMVGGEIVAQVAPATTVSNSSLFNGGGYA